MKNLDTTSFLFCLFVCLIVCFSFYHYIFYLNVQYLAGRSFYREVPSVLYLSFLFFVTFLVFMNRNYFFYLYCLIFVKIETRTKLTRIFSSSIPLCKLKFILKSSLRIGTLFNFKDHIPKTLLSGVVYRFLCGGRNATYIGKTKQHLKKRVSKHMGVSALTGKVLKGQQYTAVKPGTY